MPLYDVKCTDCGKEEEVFCSFDDLDTQGCQECGGTTEQIINNACSFKLEGQGWAGKDIKKTGEFLKAYDKESD